MNYTAGFPRVWVPGLLRGLPNGALSHYVARLAGLRILGPIGRPPNANGALSHYVARLAGLRILGPIGRPPNGALGNDATGFPRIWVRGPVRGFPNGALGNDAAGLIGLKILGQLPRAQEILDFKEISNCC